METRGLEDVTVIGHSMCVVRSVLVAGVELMRGNQGRKGGNDVGSVGSFYALSDDW